MITANRPGLEEQTPELSEESEEEILRMVEEQLDRPNPPDTKVLYRRAMHFIDRDVRHLSLQQFNAKFPLQVKRRRAMSDDAGNGASGASAGNGARTTNGRPENGPPTEERKARTGSHEEGPTPSGPENPTSEEEEASVEDGSLRREHVRSALLAYARRVASAETKAELVEAAPRVEEFVEQALETG